MGSGMAPEAELIWRRLRLSFLINDWLELGDVRPKFIWAGGGIGVSNASGLPLREKVVQELDVPVYILCGLERASHYDSSEMCVINLSDVRSVGMIRTW